MEDVETRLRAALREAMKSRDVVAASAVRSALAAIGNAGAVPPEPADRLRREARILRDVLEA
jgi:hypothetical protein